jgi:general secretion pathway protein D
MLRLTAIIWVLVLGGCADHSLKGERLREPVPDWQMRNIMGEASVGGPASSSIEHDGPIGVSLKGRGHSAVFDGGDSIAAPHPGITYNATGQVTISFNDVDAKEAAKTVLEDILNQSHVIDPKVEGKITIHSPKPVAPKDALRLLETGLQQVGAVVVIRNGVHYVMPRGQGVTEAPNAIVPAGKGGAAGYSSRAVQLRHIAATEMAEILKGSAKDTGVRVDGARNLLILSGTSAEHDAWMETVRTFDVDWLANRSVGVFKITSQQADGMVKSLTEVMRNENVDQQMVRFTTIDATNSVLAVAKTPEALKTVRQWVKRLEATGAQQQQLFSYQMKYAQAKDVAPVLAKIFGTSQTNGGDGGDKLASLGSSPTKASMSNKGGSSTNASVATNSSANGASSVSASMSAGPSSGVQVQPANGAPATSLTGARTFQTSGGSSDGSGSPAMRIIPNEGTNTLLIYATDAEYDRVKNVLRTVDVPQRQVLVEATIIEVALTDDMRYGVQYYLSSHMKGLPIEVALSNSGSKNIAPTLPGFGLSLASPAKVVIDALNDVTTINVVSAPNVMVLNNQSARLVVGDQIPIATKSSQDPLQGNNVIVNTIELRDTGVIFEVTPRINSSGSVLLDIVQEVSSVKRSADATLTPTISQRKLSSSVTVDNGETIVLGGLFSTQGQVSRSGFPGLSGLPVVGAAFGTTNDVTARTELVVLISPKIIDNRFEARAVTNEVRRRIQELRFEDQVVVPPAPVHRQRVERGPLAYPGTAECATACDTEPLTTSSITKSTPPAGPKPKPAAAKTVRPTAETTPSALFKPAID